MYQDQISVMRLPGFGGDLIAFAETVQMLAYITFG